VDSVDHAIYPQWATLTLISGNSVRQSLQGVNFQQCTKENQVLDNQIESARTGIVFNGSGIVSKNFLRGYATGIVADYSTYSAITDNVFSGTATRLSVHPSRVYHKTLSNNCDVNGNCD
jgi:nitrous oxidase accessory protein NosD